MADSQYPYPNLPDQIEAILSSISEQRILAYLLRAEEDHDFAISLYLYNARLAKAFLYQLHVVEVTFRNIVDRYLVDQFGLYWPNEPAFRDGVLDESGRKALDKAIDRADGNSIHHRVVAKLTFDFWSRLFKREYQAYWRSRMHDVFPGLPTGHGRSELQLMVRDVNKLRNRVAHHEPILDMDIPELQRQISDLLKILCPETAAWAAHHNTVNDVLKLRPSKAGQGRSTIKSKLAPKFVQVTLETPMNEVMAAFNRNCQSAVCVDDNGAVIAAFSALDITRFVMAESDRMGGLFEPATCTVEQLLDECGVAETTRLVDQSEPITHAIDLLTQAKVHMLVGTDGLGGKPTGTIMRAHRRY